MLGRQHVQLLVADLQQSCLSLCVCVKQNVRDNQLYAAHLFISITMTRLSFHIRLMSQVDNFRQRVRV